MSDNRVKINLGCGHRNFGDDWIHIDIAEYDHLTHKASAHDLPLQDEEVDLLYASHLLEYYDREQGLEVLQEWKRVLKKGGILRIAVPDFWEMARLRLDGLNLNNLLGPLYGKMEVNGETIYHKTVYDTPALESALSVAGFSNIQRWDWRKVSHGKFDDHSQSYIPHMEKRKGTLISLNLQAEK